MRATRILGAVSLLVLAAAIAWSIGDDEYWAHHTLFTGLVASLSEARRAIAQGGVSLDGAKVEGEDAVVTGSLPGGVSVLRRGKKTLAGLFVAG